MKKNIFYYSFTLVITIFLLNSMGCKKDTIITSHDALLSVTEDTLHFDTVFTTVGSTTQYLKIFNLNDKKLILSSITLMKGTASYYKINVDGNPGVQFNNVEIEANDSIYLFATVNIDPTSAQLPFIIRDSIKISYNGNNKFIQLEAYGKNAIFLKNDSISTNTVWTNSLPRVILGRFKIKENTTLTIEKGCKIYLHADAAFTVNGTLNAVGDKYDSTRIVFSGDRIDDPYRDYPASWPGIYFTETSKDNMMQFCTIKNAYQGLIVQQSKLTISECIVDNIYTIGIGGVNSIINATNCLVSNCGSNLALTLGGDYTFNNCTLTSIDNVYISHKNAVVNIDNSQAGATALAAHFNNSIIYSEGGFTDNEINIIKGTPDLTATFSNVLYKQQSGNIPVATFTDCIKNQNPVFDSINAYKRYFDFHLHTGSPCIDAGTTGINNIDLDGNPRPVGTKPDIGCYEK